MKKLLTIAFISLLSTGGVAGMDWTDNDQFSYEMEQSMIQHAQVMDQANECYRATGTYSKIVCDIYLRNNK